MKLCGALVELCGGAVWSSGGALVEMCGGAVL